MGQEGLFAVAECGVRVTMRLGQVRADVPELLAQPAFAEGALARDTQEEIETFRREALPRQITG
jgi:hypothetical protein